MPKSLRARRKRRRTPATPSPAPQVQVEHLAAAAAHDLATFRATLELESELVAGHLANPKLDPELRRHLSRLIATGRAMSHVGAHFVEVLRSTPLREDPEPVSLPALVAEVRAIFEERAARRRLLLQVSPPPPLLIREHGTLVRHLLLNLLDNAVKFSDRGVVHLRCDWSEEDGLVVRVRDEGGLVETVAAGFGMGLALLRELLKTLGGTLTRDTTAVGTQVVATVPVRAELRDVVDRGALAGVKVLLACDSPADRRDYVSLLRASGASWMTSGLGDRALRMVAGTRPATVLVVVDDASTQAAFLEQLARTAVPIVAVAPRRLPRAPDGICWITGGGDVAERVLAALAEAAWRPPGADSSRSAC